MEQKSLCIKSAVLIFFLLGVANVPLFSQNDCATKIQEAQKLYDQGMIGEIPSMLAPCMAEGFTRSQKIEAYKLIILSYLFDDNQFEAEKSMVEFLRKYPEYEIMPNDPIEFVYLFESYRTTSVFSFGLTAALNLTDPRIIEPYTLFDKNRATAENNIKPGFSVGLGVGSYLGRKLLLNLEFNFSSNNYSFYDEIKTPVTGASDAVNAVSYSEKLYKIEWPLTLAYEFSIKKTHCYIRGGFSAAKITGVTGRPSRKYSEELPPLSGETTDISDYRKNMLYGGILGAGLRYKVPRGIVLIDLRANIGLSNLVNSDKRYDNQDFITKFYHIDDDFSLNTLSLSVGYYFSFYKPKKQR